MKKVIGIALICITIASIFTACSSNEKASKPDDNNNDKNQTNQENNKSENENGDTTPTTEPDKTAFPEEHLQKLDEGDTVEALQTSLNEIGYDIAVNGTYDERTTWAITDFQIQNSLHATGIYNKETADTATQFLADEKQVDAGKGLPFKENTEKTESGNPISNNPYDVLGITNKHHALPSDFIPDDLVVPNVRFPFTEDLPKKQLRKVAADALEELFAAGDEAGMDLFAQSGFRSYDRQDAIFAANVEKNGEKAANNYSARPGESEHQTGLTMDITSPEVGYKLNIEFGDTAEGKWVKENASDYGFIIRYPEDKVDITEYQYEPWHLRYVGKKAAKEITEKGLSFEEYLGEK
ncbi:MAG TPA: D-alanyl-D-alanine carboxypeptidase family protein [Bacillota bacterium]|nr:D-alanyl-D-alanine carboxypeptidase family protein [Bacillota bacterium]